MIKSGSTHLFLLIKSLSKGEKRFFKRWSQLYASGRNNKYIRLFDAIDRQDANDEQKLLKNHKDISYGKQFPVLKNYLYGQLLKCMDHYHQSSHSEVRSLLHKVEFLVDKGLYSSCEKILRKAKLKAEQYNMPHYALELFRPWEKTLIAQRNDVEGMKRLLQEEQKTTDQLLRSREYQTLENQMYVYYLQSHGKRVKSIVRQAKKILQHKLMKHPEKNNLFEDKINFHWIYYSFYQISRDIPNSYLRAKSMLQLFHQSPEKCPLHVSLYLRIINNFLMSCIQLRKHEEIPQCLSDMREIKNLVRPNTETAKTYFFRYANHSVLYYLETGKYEAGRDAVEEIVTESKQYQKKLNDLERSALYVNLALFYWGLNDLHKCLDWINKIHSQVTVFVRDDLKLFLDVFFIIAHYEARHYELVLSLVRAARRQLKKKELSYQTESLMLQFFPRIIKASSNEEKIALFTELKNQLIPLAKNPTEKQSFDYFDYLGWVESKIQKRSFAEIVREKAKYLEVS